MTDDEMEKFDEKRGEAMSSFSEVRSLYLDTLSHFFHQGEWEAAIALFTEAIKLNPNSAAMFAKRGCVDYLKLSSFCNISTSSGHASLRFRNQMHVFEIVQGKDGFP